MLEKLCRIASSILLEYHTLQETFIFQNKEAKGIDAKIIVLCNCYRKYMRIVKLDFSPSTINYKIAAKEEMQSIAGFLDAIAKLEKSYTPYKTTPFLPVLSMTINLQKSPKSEDAMNRNLKIMHFSNF